MGDLSIIAGLGEVSGAYDALICDIWGVLHNGREAHAAAVGALKRYRKTEGRVALVSNAPRPAADVKSQLDQLGVSPDCYDAIVTSGALARAELLRRSHQQTLRLFHLGPERDRGIFEGLDIELVAPPRAEVILCTGLFDDTKEHPEDYSYEFDEMTREGSVPMICANPDQLVMRGTQLVWCAGALAALYERKGGEVIWFGKPYRPIYDEVSAALEKPARVLAIGDGIDTDIKGANGVGLDALFIADGIHGESVEPFTKEHIESLLAESGTVARFSMRALVW